MQLYFRPGPWDGNRYRYPAEQMMLTLFPGERPEYPADEPAEGAVFSLTAEGETARLACRLTREGQTRQGSSSFPAEELDAPPEAVYHSIQHALKMAFYQAGTDLLGYEPPWGALTGVRPVKLPTRALREGRSLEQAVQELETEYRVSPVRAGLAADCALASERADREMGADAVSLYIGIPFCPTRCAYCSFVSADVRRSLKVLSPYLEALEQELKLTGEILRKAGRKIRTLYMGGGTPTTLSAEQLDRLLAAVTELLPLEGNAEFTVEAGRPDTVTPEKLAVLRTRGAGRISINPQTLNDEVLQAIGRQHTAEDVFRAFRQAREAGFACINMDLIAGLPRDSFEGFVSSLTGVLELRPENITVHTLALKKGSRLMEEGGPLPPGGETARMVDASLDLLRRAGYSPYYLYRQKYMSGSLENVGWCLPGTENLYNIAMMEELHTVISCGGGGVTKLVDRERGSILRITNPKYPHDYLNALDRVLEKKRELTGFFGCPP